MIRVLIVDDSQIITSSLKTILEQNKEFQIVGSGSDGMEAYRWCCRYKPDIVLMDIKMPVYDGMDGVKRIKEEFGDRIKVLMLTTFGNASFLEEAVKSGADGYLLKGLDNNELINAIKAAYCGLMVINQSLVKKQPSKHVEYINTSTADSKQSELTWIEYTILKGIVEGRSSKEIASALGISDGSVRNKVSALLARFGVGNRTSLAIYAVENGYV